MVPNSFRSIKFPSNDQELALWISDRKKRYPSGSKCNQENQSVRKQSNDKKSPKICKFFLKNSCKKDAAQCKYLHIQRLGVEKAKKVSTSNSLICKLLANQVNVDAKRLLQIFQFLTASENVNLFIKK